MGVITPRLQCIIDHTNGTKIADIGTDHAYIPIHLIQNDMAEYVIAGDVCQGPVDIAKANIEANGEKNAGFYPQERIIQGFIP